MARLVLLWALVLASCAALEADESDTPVSPVNQAAATQDRTAEPTVALAVEPTPDPEPEPEFVNDPRWHETVLAIAKAYPSWGRVDDEARWAPGLCRMPRPAQARISASDDATTHGSKLYTVYAMDAKAYGFPPGVAMGFQDVSGVKQVLVKEAFSPKEAPPDYDWQWKLRPATHEGKQYVPGDPRGIYVMFQLPKPDAESDAGWVYATVDADLKTVTAAGRIDSCMGCHQTEEDRLFGLPNSAQALPPTNKANAAH